MRKGILYLIIFNLGRFLILLFANKSLHLRLSATMFGFDNPNIISEPLKTSIAFDNPFFSSNHLSSILLATLMFLVVQLCFLLLLSKIVRNEKKWLVWIMLISSIMISPWMNLDFYDLTFLILWMIAIYAFYSAIFCTKNYFWIIGGLFLGLGYMLKSYMAALPIGIIVFLIFSTKYRFHIFSIRPYLMLIIAFVLSTPYSQSLLGLDFNSTQNHAFASPEVTGFHPMYFIGFSIAQAFILTPVLFIGFWWLFFKYFGRIINKPNQVNPEFWFLLCFFIPMFLGVYVISFFYSMPIDQLLPIYLVGLIIFGKLMKKRWLYWHLGLSIAAYLIMIFLPNVS